MARAVIGHHGEASKAGGIAPVGTDLAPPVSHARNPAFGSASLADAESGTGTVHLAQLTQPTRQRSA
jgi:hypothetical protein